MSMDLEPLPHQLDKVKHPMDLRTIWKRVESVKCTSLTEVDQDIRLVLKTCFSYNVPGAYAYGAAKMLEKYYRNISQMMINCIAASSISGTSAGSAVSALIKRCRSS